MTTARMSGSTGRHSDPVLLMNAAGKGPRFYRYRHRRRAGRRSFQVTYRETDLWISAAADLRREALQAVLNCRHQLDAYLARCPRFLTSLTPLPHDPTAPRLIVSMLDAAARTGVGPMAAVAGAIARAVAIELKPLSPSLIIENGGDCYMDPGESTTVGIYSGPGSPFSGKIALHFDSTRFPLGICTSSGTLGHSLSFGKADAVTAVAKDAALADAAATAIANRVRTPRDIQDALDFASTVEDLSGVLILIEENMGLWGELELVPA